MTESEAGPVLPHTETRTAMPMDRETPARIVPFAPDLLPSVRGFCERYWSRPRTEAYYDWRYLRSQPFGRMFLALQGEDCLGMLFALRKQYRLGGRPTACLEVFDWHCLPGLRGSGIGIRLMRAMMRQPEPIISVGGTEDVLATLPLMGWKPIGVARRYVLPVSADVLATRLQRRTGLPAAISRVALGIVSSGYYQPRRRMVPGASSVTPGGPPGEEIQQLYREETGYSFVQEPEPHVLGWMTDSAWSGKFGTLTFALEGRQRGWAMTRTHMTRRGLEAAIIEVFAPRPNVDLYTWMVSEAAVSLMADQPQRIHARASCPVLQAALLANHFGPAVPDSPIHVWPKGVADSAASLHITLNHSDSPFMPYEPEPRAAAKPPS
jgi:hypothetical protein